MVARLAQRFGLGTQGEYHDCYLHTDVLAVADVMKAFRATCFDLFQIDPLQCLTLPPPPYRRATLYPATKTSSDLICEENCGWPLMNDVNNNTRGGLSGIFQPYAQANNHKLVPTWDAKKMFGL